MSLLGDGARGNSFKPKITKEMDRCLQNRRFDLGVGHASSLFSLGRSDSNIIHNCTCLLSTITAIYAIRSAAVLKFFNAGRYQVSAAPFFGAVSDRGGPGKESRCRNLMT